MPDVAVIGLGATGAAMGRALRASGATVAGYDPHPPTARRAAQAGAVDAAAPSLEKAVAGARIILLATPLADMRDALAAVGSLAPQVDVVTDACILKAPVMEWARERLPPSVPFVGGRPILRGPDDANANKTSPLASAAYPGANADETSPRAGAAYPGANADADRTSSLAGAAYAGANADADRTSPLAGAAYAGAAGADETSPFAGAAYAGVNADANETSLFAGADYAITADADAPPDAVDAVAALARAVGAEPFFVDTAEHDSFVIAVEMLPRIAAAAAVDAAASAPAWRDARRLSGAAFQYAVRAAELDPAELAIAIRCAPDALRARLDGLAAALDAIRALAAAGAEADWERTAQILADRNAARRARLSASPSAPHSPPLERPSLSALLLGERLGGERRGRK